MTEDVLAHGADERPGGSGRLVGVVVAVALLGVFGVAVARNRPVGDDRPAPAPSTSTHAPLPPPSRYVDDPFAAGATFPMPAEAAVVGVLLPGDVPGFLVGGDGDDLPEAFEAFGGPAHDRVVLGWCASSRTFQDDRRTHVFDTAGQRADGGTALAFREVRLNAADPRSVDVAATTVRHDEQPPRDLPVEPPCAGGLTYPPLPPTAEHVHQTIRGHRVVRGRYVVSTETTAFCAPVGPGCAAQGWEVHGDALPPGDLAGSYTWEGRFVVRGDPDDGRLGVARLPGARLVKRERVGRRAMVGSATAVTTRDGVAYLRFSAVGEAERAYPIRPDVDLFLGPGFTGLGRPRGTPETLRRYLATTGRPDTQWVVLDGADRVLRVVVA